MLNRRLCATLVLGAALACVAWSQEVLPSDDDLQPLHFSDGAHGRAVWIVDDASLPWVGEYLYLSSQTTSRTVLMSVVDSSTGATLGECVTDSTDGPLQWERFTWALTGDSLVCSVGGGGNSTRVRFAGGHHPRSYSVRIQAGSGAACLRQLVVQGERPVGCPPHLRRNAFTAHAMQCGCPTDDGTVPAPSSSEETAETEGPTFPMFTLGGVPVPTQTVGGGEGVMPGMLPTTIGAMSAPLATSAPISSSPFPESPCARHLCHNNGTCVVAVDGTPSCLCQSGYIGAHCEQGVCDGVPCAHGGMCRPEGTTARCVCPPHATGLLCETLICEHECANGECVLAEGETGGEDGGGPMCRCSQGFIGPNCNAIDVCIGNAACSVFGESARCELDESAYSRVSPRLVNASHDCFCPHPSTGQYLDCLTLVLSSTTTVTPPVSQPTQQFTFIPPSSMTGSVFRPPTPPSAPPTLAPPTLTVDGGTAEEDRQEVQPLVPGSPVPPLPEHIQEMISTLFPAFVSTTASPIEEEEMGEEHEPSTLGTLGTTAGGVVVAGGDHHMAAFPPPTQQPPFPSPSPSLIPSTFPQPSTMSIQETTGPTTMGGGVAGGVMGEEEEEGETGQPTHPVLTWQPTTESEEGEEEVETLMGGVAGQAGAATHPMTTVPVPSTIGTLPPMSTHGEMEHVPIGGAVGGAVTEEMHPSTQSLGVPAWMMSTVHPQGGEEMGEEEEEEEEEIEMQVHTLPPQLPSSTEFMPESTEVTQPTTLEATTTTTPTTSTTTTTVTTTTTTTTEKPTTTTVEETRPPTQPAATTTTKDNKTVVPPAHSRPTATVAPADGDAASATGKQQTQTTSSAASWIVAIVAVCVLGLLLLASSLFVARYIRQSRKLHGKYNPAREEHALSAAYALPMGHVTKEERLI